MAHAGRLVLIASALLMMPAAGAQTPFPPTESDWDRNKLEREDPRPLNIGMLSQRPTIDGVIPLVHSTGCGIDSDGETFEVLKRTTWGYATNPNMAGVVVVGLGCEGFQIARMKEAQTKLLDELWDKRDPGLPVATKEEAIILASIVEKETGNADEQPMVAGVFVNRLRKRMRLQSDPTIIYGITLFVILSIAILMFLVDLIYPLLDPRIRYESR